MLEDVETGVADIPEDIDVEGNAEGEDEDGSPHGGSLTEAEFEGSGQVAMVDEVRQGDSRTAHEERDDRARDEVGER